MFNAMMDPELMKLAQEQMSRMSPAELARIQQQMMANPDLMRMASESMMNMRPEDLKHAAEQLKDTRPEEMAEIGEKMANASPDEIAAMRAQFEAHVTYELNGVQMLKKQGNELHSQGRFEAALEKYLLAKKNLKEIPLSRSKTLLLACSLNLMSCYLKTKQYEECITEGLEVLEFDANNVKALYRRGQAYKELGRFGDAVSDLRKALDVSPDDETIAQVLRDAEERLARQGSQQGRRGLIIEEITEENGNEADENPTESLEQSAVQERGGGDAPNSMSSQSNGGSRMHSTIPRELSEDPQTIRSFQNFISNANPETLAALSDGKTGEISPEMFKTASNMISNMSPEELQRVLQMASQFQGQNPFASAGSSSKSSNGFDNGFSPVPPNVTPDMLKTASDMMSKMSSEELQKMFEMASSLREKDSFPVGAASDLNRSGSKGEPKHPAKLENIARSGDNVNGETSSSDASSSSSKCVSQPSFPSSTADLQEQMRNQMKDPAMRQMFTSMMKNLSPEMMANMSEQFGMKLSKEDAARAQQAMSSLSPETLDTLMLWTGRIQRGVEGIRKTKDWLLGRQGMILAIVILILAMIFHWLGFIGR